MVLKKKAFNTFVNCRHGQFETLPGFKERFEFRYQNFIEQKNPAKEDEDLAIGFMYAMDGARYDGFVAKILNNV